MKRKNSPATFTAIISFLILFGLAFSILDFLSPVMPFLIAAIIIGAILYLFFYSSKPKKKEVTFADKPSLSTEPVSIQNEIIKRQVTILSESIKLVNDSNNLDVVLRRYAMTYDTLNKLSGYTDSEIRNAGYSLKEPLGNTCDYIKNNKVLIINQAIERHIENELASLTTVNGKIQRLDSIYNRYANNKKLEKDNLSFLKNLCHSMKEELKPSPLTNAKPAIVPNLTNTLNVAPEIADLVWIGDGEFKNYDFSTDTPTTNVNNSFSIISSKMPEEPSVLYLSLPVSAPEKNIPVESPPYFPIYRELSPEQRWLYWEFLSKPFSQEHNIGYVFLFYYGLERHLLSGNLDKSFSIILKFREMYDNNSFQHYTARSLTLVCISKKRADLALKFLESDSRSDISSIPINYLLLLKYSFQIPLTASEIIKNHTYFLFNNTRYIKNHPELFSETFQELIHREFQANSIDLNQHFPINIQQLPVKQERIFANISLSNYEIPVPIFENKDFIKKISSLLNETHETVKSKLRELRKHT